MFKPQPMYVTRAVQQAYGIDHPIGDPFGGAAYGEKNGGGSVGKIFSSVLPIVAGAAMMMTPGLQPLGMVIAGGMIAGGAMSGIGAITGNQTLSKIGGITSAVAGVAGLGYSAYTNWDSISNFFANGTELAGTGANVAGESIALQPGESITDALVRAQQAGNTAVQGGAAAADMLAVPTAAAFQGGGYNAEQLAGELGNQIQATQAPVAQSLQANLTPGNMLAANTQGVVDTGGVGSSLGKVGLGQEYAMFGGDAGTGFGTAQPFTGTPAPLPGSTASFGSTGGATVGDVGSYVSGQLDGGGGGLLSSAGQFVKDNPVVSLMGFQTLAGLAEGASPKSQAEGEYLQAMAQLKIAEADYINSGKSKEAEDAFNRAKAYELEKRKAYNDSIVNMQQANTSNLYQSMYPGAANPTGIINQARA